MTNIINNIKAIFNSTNGKNDVVKCNYSNNYYGDQYCQIKGNEVKDR